MSYNFSVSKPAILPIHPHKTQANAGQGASRFRIFDLADGHRFLGSVALSARSTDGCEVFPGPLPGYPNGLFVTMSDGRTFHFYHWSDVLKELQTNH